MKTQTNPKFKIGDEVIVVKESAGWPVGTIGKITAIDSRYQQKYTVESNCKYLNFYHWYHKEDELELTLITPPDPTKKETRITAKLTKAELEEVLKLIRKHDPLATHGYMHEWY